MSRILNDVLQAIATTRTALPALTITTLPDVYGRKWGIDYEACEVYVAEVRSPEAFAAALTEALRRLRVGRGVEPGPHLVLLPPLPTASQDTDGPQSISGR